MPNQTSSPSIVGLIAVAEVILLFVLGVVGNKLADSLAIPVPTIVSLMTICLVIMAWIAYRNSENSSASASNLNVGIARYLPNSMWGMIPFGVLFGLGVGSLISTVGYDWDGIGMPLWVANAFGFEELKLAPSEFTGVAIGVVSCFLFALIINGFLGGGLAIGFGLSFPTALLLFQPFLHSPLPTYLGHSGGFLVFGIVLALFSGLFRWIFEEMNRPRI